MTKHDEISQEGPSSTELEKMIYGLPSRQAKALDALLSGQNITGAAAIAGVSRQTLSGWLNHDFTFIAAYNRRRQLLADEISNRLRALAVKAFDALEQELEGERKLEAAKAILRVATSLTVPTGPTLPAEAENQRRAHQQQVFFSGLSLG